MLQPGFDATLPAAESMVLRVGTNDAAIKATEDNNSTMAILKMSMKTLEMLIMIMLEKKRDPDWPTGKHSEVYKKIKKRFVPDDEMAEMDMEDNLRKIKLQKTRDPKKLLDDIAAVEVQYGCMLAETKKAGVVICAGKTHYASLMAMMGSATRAAHNRNETAEELVAEMYLQYRIMGLDTGKRATATMLSKRP